MMIYKKLHVIFAILGFSSGAQAELVEFNNNKDNYQIEILEGVASIRKNSAEILHKALPNEVEKPAFVVDFNFDHYPDLAVLRDAGIERYFDVYLFDKKNGMYVLSKPISALACPDVNPKSKLVLSTCNHSNSCESWRDSYRYTNRKLTIVRRDGTSCDPSTGQAYQYSEIYKNGRVLKHTSIPLGQ